MTPTGGTIKMNDRNRDPDGARARGHALREARAARGRKIRRRVVAGALALFVATWLMIAVVLISGHDPALAARKSTTVTASSSGTTGTSSSGTSASSSGTTGTSSSGTSASGSGTTAASGSGTTGTSTSGGSGSSVTTRQS